MQEKFFLPPAFFVGYVNFSCLVAGRQLLRSTGKGHCERGALRRATVGGELGAVGVGNGFGNGRRPLQTAAARPCRLYRLQSQLGQKEGDQEKYRQRGGADEKGGAPYGVTLLTQTAGSQLVGRLEDAAPNLRRPTSVTVQGAKLEVNDRGREALSTFSIGDIVKVTLDRAGKVDGVSAASGERNVGLPTLGGDRASLALPGVTISGTLSNPGYHVSTLVGSLVQAKVEPEGELSVSALASKSYLTSLNVADRTLGEDPLAADVVLYEHVGSAPVQALSLDDILTPTVEAEDIEYVGYNAAGEVDLLLLQDVTGNCYTYGKLIKGSATSGTGKMAATDRWITLAQAKAYANSFTAYLDRPVETGGQVRIIVAEE